MLCKRRKTRYTPFRIRVICVESPPNSYIPIISLRFVESTSTCTGSISRIKRSLPICSNVWIYVLVLCLCVCVCVSPSPSNEHCLPVARTSSRGRGIGPSVPSRPPALRVSRSSDSSAVAVRRWWAAGWPAQSTRALWCWANGSAESAMQTSRLQFMFKPTSGWMNQRKYQPWAVGWPLALSSGSRTIRCAANCDTTPSARASGRWSADSCPAPARTGSRPHSCRRPAGGCRRRWSVRSATGSR